MPDPDAVEAARVVRCDRCGYESDGDEFVEGEEDEPVVCPACGATEVTIVHP